MTATSQSRVSLGHADNRICHARTSHAALDGEDHPVHGKGLRRRNAAGCEFNADSGLDKRGAPGVKTLEIILPRPRCSPARGPGFESDGHVAIARLSDPLKTCALPRPVHPL